MHNMVWRFGIRTPQSSLAPFVTRAVYWIGLSKRRNSSTADRMSAGFFQFGHLFRFPEQTVDAACDQVSRGFMPHEEQHHALRVELLFRERFLFLFDINQ